MMPGGTPTRLLGAGILLLAALPLQPLLYTGEPGTPAHHLGSLAAGYSVALWAGAGFILFASLPFGFLGFPRRARKLGSGIRGLLLRPGDWSFAMGVGLLAGILGLLLSWYAFALQPALHDATGHLIDARYLASGRLAGPELSHPEFFTFQQMVNLPSGWQSQYPPGFAILLAFGMLTTVPWLVGPVLAAVTATLTCRVAHALELEPATQRLGGVLAGLSLFFLAQGASYMSHTGAAALGTLAILSGLRSVRSVGRLAPQAAWALMAGVASGSTFAVRPLAGVIVGAVVAFSLWRGGGVGSRSLGPRNGSARAVAFVVGMLPPLMALAHFHRRMFGEALTFGYTAAQGPGSGPGFHLDPWGYTYTPREGLGQMSGDLAALGLDLFVTPLSAVLVVAAGLLLTAPGSFAWRLLLLWGLLPIGAHFFYWHQDFFLGPRLLSEFYPAWALLTALSVCELIRWARSNRLPLVPRLDLESWMTAAFLSSALLALTVLIPFRAAGYASQWGPEVRTPLPEPPESALVFVHGDWSDRLGARLAAMGVRVDSIRAVMRHSTNCEVQEFLDRWDHVSQEPETSGWRGTRNGPDRVQELWSGPRQGVELMEMTLPSGTVVRTFPGEVPSPGCQRELRADRFGTVPLLELLWRGDLPGLEEGLPMFARDLGPHLNPRLLDAFPDREALLYVPPQISERPALVPYREGLTVLWDPDPEDDRSAPPSG